jgi:hypothetical protein
MVGIHKNSHIGIEAAFRPAKKAHPALRLRDEATLLK